MQHGPELPHEIPEYMKQAEEEQADLREQIREQSRIAQEARHGYDNEIHRRDVEIEELRKKLEEMNSRNESLKAASSVLNYPTTSKENLQRSSSVPSYLLSNDNIQRSTSVPNDPVQKQRPDSMAAGNEQLRTQRVEVETERQPSRIAKEMREMLIEMILLRVEVAELYKEWQSMASLAATALDEASILMSGSLMARCYFYRGVALYRLGFYWEADTTFQESKQYTETPAEQVEVERWLEKAKQAQVAAQSAVSRQSSVFDPIPVKPRTDSIPVMNALAALKDELNFDSDFDSIRGFGSRTPSVQTLLSSAAESPHERQPRSPQMGSPQPTYSPLQRAPNTSRIRSPLIPQSTLPDSLVSEPNNSKPIPSRTASIGMQPFEGHRGSADQLSRQLPSQSRTPSSPLAQQPSQRFSGQGKTPFSPSSPFSPFSPLAPQLSRGFSGQRRTPHSSALPEKWSQRLPGQRKPPSSPLARRMDNGGISNNRKTSESDLFRYSVIRRHASTVDARRQSQLKSIGAGIDAPALRRPSSLSREIEQIELGDEAGLDPIDEVSEASEGSADHLRNDKMPESKDSLQSDLDRLLSESRSDKGGKSAGNPPIPSDFEHGKQLADRLQDLADQRNESMSPGSVDAAEPVSDDEPPFQGGDEQRDNHVISPVRSDHHIEDEKTQEVEENEVLSGAIREPTDRSGLQAELDRNAEYLANLEKDGEAIPQEALEFNGENPEEFSTEPEIGIAEQASTNDRSSGAGDQSKTVTGAPVEKGGPDDLYDVEDDYVAPTPGLTSGVSTPAAETGEDSDVENIHWEVIPRDANASSPPKEPSNVAEGAASQGLGIRIPQKREQETEHSLERMDDAEVPTKLDTEPPLSRIDEEKPKEGAMEESSGKSEARKDEEETNQVREPDESPKSNEGKANNSKKTKKKKKKGKR